MKKSAAIFTVETAEEVLAHGNEQQGKTQSLVACFLGITDPMKAYVVATELVKRKNAPPIISTRDAYHLFQEEVQKFLDENGVQKFPGDYVIHDDRIIMYQPMHNLIKQFENDIIYDCHQLRTKAGRSDSGKEIIRRGRESLKPMVEYLPTQKDYNDDVFLAATMLLAWLGQEHKLEGMPEKLADVDGWVAWAKCHAIS